MSLDSLKELMNGFDPETLLESLIPDLTTIMGWVEMVMRICVMTGPLVLLGLGLYYFLNPPAEANHIAGYRCRRGMASVESWQFTQRLAGIVFSVLGLVLTIVMTVLCTGLTELEPMDMLLKAVRYLIWQIVLIAGSCVLINLTVMICFTMKGYRRQWRRDYEEE